MASKNQKPNKSKTVNILYFIDSNRTKSFKISLSKLYLTIAALTVILIWTTISSFFLYKNTQNTVKQEQKISNLLSVIFQYQQRYDNIYEKSYPESLNNMNTTVAPESETPLSKATLSAKSMDTKTTKELVQNEIKNDSNSLSIDNNSTEKKIIQKEAKFNSILKDIKAKNVKNQKIEIEFSIKNESSPKKSTGYVIAKATIKNGKKVSILTAPKIAKLNSKDLPVAYKGYKFNIRYFKSTNLMIELPKKENMDIHKLELLLYSENSLEHRYEVDVKEPKVTKKETTQTPSTKKPKEESVLLETKPSENKVNMLQNFPSMQANEESLFSTEKPKF